MLHVLGTTGGLQPRFPLKLSASIILKTPVIAHTSDS